jgi:hypothetical protein
MIVYSYALVFVLAFLVGAFSAHHLDYRYHGKKLVSMIFVFIAWYFLGYISRFVQEYAQRMF